MFSINSKIILKYPIKGLPIFKLSGKIYTIEYLKNDQLKLKGIDGLWPIKNFELYETKKVSKENKMNYRKIIALLGHEARVWDMVEQGRSDSSIEEYIRTFLPEYKELLLTEGLNAVLEKIEEKDTTMKQNFKEDRKPFDNIKNINIHGLTQ